MKSTFLTILGMLFMLSSSQAEGIKFFKGSWKEAVAASKETGKPLFVDAYTTWCGPCKRMSREVFTQKEVGDFYNQNYIAVKLDMERGDGKAFAQKHRVTAYPTLLFLDQEEKVFFKKVGGLPPAQFIELGEMALTKYDPSFNAKIAYEASNKRPKAFITYLKTLAKSDKPRAKETNKYLRNTKDISAAEKAEIAFLGMESVDSRLNELALGQVAILRKAYGNETILKYWQRAAEKTTMMAAKYSTPELFTEALDTYKKVAPKDKHFRYKLEALNAMMTNNHKLFVKRAPKILKEEKGQMDEYLKYMVGNVTDKKLKRKAFDWVKIDPNENTYYMAMILCRQLEDTKKEGEFLKEATSKLNDVQLRSLKQRLEMTVIGGKK